MLLDIVDKAKGLEVVGQNVSFSGGPRLLTDKKKILFQSQSALPEMAVTPDGSGSEHVVYVEGNVSCKTTNDKVFFIYLADLTKMIKQFKETKDRL